MIAYMKANRMRIFISAIVLSAGLLVGTFTANAAFAKNVDSKPDFPKNSRGQTYGSDMGVMSSKDEPDLVKAQGDDGTIGYVLSSDLYGGEPSSPEEAIARQNKNEKKAIPLYASDGTTIIGKMTSSSASSAEHQSAQKEVNGETRSSSSTIPAIEVNGK